MFKRIHLIVMDSVGIGEAPDAADFNDLGANTLGNIAENIDLKLPNLTKLGLGRIHSLRGIESLENHQGYVSKLEEESVGKDTMTGHWELAGLKTQQPFQVFPNGFPPELIAKIEVFSGRKVVCNAPYSGTQVLEDYGKGQLETGALIVYTSADPVLQIAAHEEVIPLEELYRICEYVREITREAPYMIGRIIARPYLGEPGNYYRTSHRHDYALNPFSETILDSLIANQLSVIAIGKIEDIFNGQGISKAIRTKDNMDGINQLLNVMKLAFTGISFTNLVDFDALYGHRRDTVGYGQALEAFDQRIPELLELLEENDLLLITADHGNDPTFPGTDHTREYVPLIAYSKRMEGYGFLPQGKFSDIAETIADNFDILGTGNGTSFLKYLI